MSQLDLVIRNGTIVDGTGAPGRRGDLGICDGRIVATGQVEGDAAEEIDATGQVVAPGFIDIHTHYDAQIFWDRGLSPSPWHGVTSVVVGNCGFGVAPTLPAHRDLILRTLENVEGMSLSALHAGLGTDWPFESFPEYLDAIEARGSTLNVAALVGHTPIRTYVLGDEAVSREATRDEIAAQRRLVREALEAGAIGFATSKAVTHVGYDGNPVPSRAASHEEILELAGALTEVDHGIVQATTGPGLATREFVELVKQTGKPLTWTALLTGFSREPERDVLAEHARLQAEGLRIHPQVTPRPVMFEYQWKAPFALEALREMQPASKADFDGKKKLYADPDFRAALAHRIDHTRLKDRFYLTAISAYDPDESLLERSLGEVSEERGCHPVDLALDLALDTELEARFRMAAANTDEETVGEMLQHSASVLGLSDAGAHASQLCDAGLPSTLLGKWVREKKVLALEEAVRRLTSEPADLFGLRTRGRLAEGLAADVTVFDPERVEAKGLRRVYDLPGGADRLVEDADGYEAVVVNGVVVRRRNQDVLTGDDALPGRLLRGGQA